MIIVSYINLSYVDSPCLIGKKQLLYPLFLVVSENREINLEHFPSVSHQPLMMLGRLDGGEDASDVYEAIFQ